MIDFLERKAFSLF